MYVNYERIIVENKINIAKTGKSCILGYTRDGLWKMHKIYLTKVLKMLNESDMILAQKAAGKHDR